MNSQNQKNEFEKYHNKLPVEGLVNLAFFERTKIKKEARNSANNELRKRKITNKEIDSIRKEIRKRKSLERKIKLKEKDNGYNILDFLLEVLFSFLSL